MSNWTVELTSKTLKSIKALPDDIRSKFATLIYNIENNGPIQHSWPNFSKLSDTRYHCHVKKGKPTYVACWQVLDKKIKLVEIYYAGTHEKAPY